MRSIHTSELLGSGYQLEKYVKHTVPDPQYPVQSVFGSASTQAYADYVCAAAAAGALQIDDRGRRNIIWAAGLPIGFEVRNGVIRQPQEVVKLVLSSETQKIHAFPQASSKFEQAQCHRCGNPVIV